MNKEYPTLKPGDRISCKTTQEAQALGGNLTNNDISYKIHGKTIYILKEGNNGQFKRNSRTSAGK